MYEKLFSKRLAELRIQKGVSARDMAFVLERKKVSSKVKQLPVIRYK